MTVGSSVESRRSCDLWETAFQFTLISMAWKIEDLEILEKAIATGAKSVQFTDRKVERFELADLLKIRDLIKKELGLVSGGGGRIYAGFSKGLKEG